MPIKYLLLSILAFFFIALLQVDIFDIIIIVLYWIDFFINLFSAFYDEEVI